MTDLISRQAAIDALDKHCDNVCQYSKKQRSVMCGACPLGTAFDVIEDLPAAQMWIPCSERLPEEGKEVLISTKGYSLYLGALEFVDDLVRWYDTQEYMKIMGVSAWMPLPEPYKQEDKR